MVDTHIHGKIGKICESVSGDLIAFLQDLIRIPSPSGKEGHVVERIRLEMDKCGFDRVWTDDMGNCFGRLGNGEHILAIDGHCDTVDVGNPDNWNRDPFEACIRDGVVCGRGAADQKGGLASAVYTGVVLRELGIPRNMSLVVAATVLEEDFEGLCWQTILREKTVLPEAVLLTEPSGLGVRIGQRGRVEFRIRTEGVSCHGSAPERGVNAIYKMTPIIEALKRLHADLIEHPILGKGSMTVTDIRSEAPSLCAVADVAMIHIDRRLTAGETERTASEAIKALTEFKEADAVITIPEYDIESYTGKKLHMRAYYPMWMMETDHELVRLAVEVHQRTIGGPSDLGPWTFSTNGVATRGIHGIPTIGLGPGEERHAHAPTDQVTLNHIKKSLEYYALFSLAWSESRS